MSTILIVEDEEMSRNHLVRVLKRRGFKTLTATLGSEAVRLYLKHRPGIILLDLKLPDTDGLNILERIKEIDRRAIIYIITGMESGMYQKKAEALGVDGYLTKPFAIDELLRMVGI